uniref:CRAL-TRIO domain-containing protein n=1 Tax=Rhodnius prolixus TaxID=13249 RepID=T1I018_RHOPR
MSNLARIHLNDVPLIESFKLGTSILEMMLNDLVLQVSGTIIVFDMAGLSLLDQARLITPTIAWHLTMIVQDKIPMRLKAIHVLNQPFYFNACYSVFKPLLKKKLRKRIFLHGSDMESFHQHIDPENLPEEWGGSRPSFSISLTRTLIQLNEHKFKGASTTEDTGIESYFQRTPDGILSLQSTLTISDHDPNPQGDQCSYYDYTRQVAITSALARAYPTVDRCLLANNLSTHQTLNIPSYCNLIFKYIYPLSSN